MPGPSGILMFFLMPYLSTIFLNGMETALLNRKFHVEMILPAVAASQIPEKYELETIKAQSVIARSNFCRRMDNGENFTDLMKDTVKLLHPTYFIFRIPPFVYEKAATETEGEILMLQKEWKPLPYHEISAGKTRDGQEVFRSEEYCYLHSVDSAADKEADGYLNSIYIEAHRLPKKLKIKNRDSAGYVTEILADGKVLEGEAFRKGMALTSSNFSIQKIGEKMRFLCRGKGHGLGFSQNGGNTLAIDGCTYREMLEYYFPEMEIQKCE